MTATCPCCGQSLPSDATDDGAYHLGLTDEWAEAPTGSEPKQPAGTGVRIMTVLASVAAVWLIGAMLFSSVFTGDDQGQSDAPTSPSSTDAPATTGDASTTDNEAATDTATDDETATETATDDKAAIARGRRPDTRIAYVVPEGVQVLTIEGGEVSATTITPSDQPPFGLAEAKFLTPARPDIDLPWTYVIQVVDAAYDDGPERLIVDELTGSFARMANPGDFVWAAEIASNEPELFPFEVSVVQWQGGEPVALRSSHRPLLVDGVGVLIPSRDGTDIATNRGFERFSDYEVLAATSTFYIEQRCASTFECDRFLNKSDGSSPATQLPDSISYTDDHYNISPDGSMVLRIAANGSGDLFFVEDEAAVLVAGQGMSNGVWADDSSYLTWLSIGDNPQLNMFFPATRDWVHLDTEALGASTPVSTELLIID